MAGPGSVQVPPDSSGKAVDMVSLSVAGVNVVRQVMALGGATDNSSAYAEMAASAPAVSAVGMVVRHAGAINVSAMPTVTVTGGVAISGTAIVAGSVVLSGTATIAGNVNISTMPAVNISTMPTVTVTGGVAISGTAQVAIATPFTVNNISATVNVVGQVSLGAGTANIGLLDYISRTVQVAIATPYIIQGISTTVQVAGSLTIGGFVDRGSYTAGQANVTIIGGIFGDAYTELSSSLAGAAKITSARALHVNLRDAAGGALGTAGAALHVNVQAISATASVVLAAGTANFGTLNDISRTVQVAVATPFTVQGISTTVQVAIATPFIVQGISTTVQVAGSLTVGSFIDGASYTAGQANVTIMGGIFGDAYTALASSLGGAIKITSARAMHVNLRDSAGAEVTAFAISGTATIAGNVNISTMPAVNISTMPTVTVTGGVAISGTATVAGSIAATIVGVSNGVAINISTMPTVTVTGGVAISGTATVAGSVGATIIGVSNGVAINISTMPSVVVVGAAAHASAASGAPVLAGAYAAVTAPAAVASADAVRILADVIGRLIVVQNFPPAVPSASRGPRCVTASTSANVTLIAAPGASTSIYITQLGGTNASGTNTALRCGPSSSASTVLMYCASGGGGFVYQYSPPWKLSANEALLGSVKPNASQAYFNIHFYVAAT